jgi:hypothetical protein
MSIQFKDVVASASASLTRDHGFQANGRMFTREDDELIRSVRFAPGSSTARSFRFEVICNLGISGVSSVSPKSAEWVVSCNLSHVPASGDLPKTWFELTKGPGDDAVERNVTLICAHVFDNFLLMHESAEGMFLWVRDNALEFLGDPQADNDFKRLRLWPWNVMPRLELAGVYAAYLGRKEDAEYLESVATGYAKTHGMRHAIPVMHANIATVARIR